MKVKPFYIRITDNMTLQMVQDAFDKCRKLGVKDTELCDSLVFNHWVYFGVCGSDGLYYSDYHENFHGDAKEITLDQLDEWLGLEVEQEWNGEGLPPVGVECEYFHEPRGLWVKFVPLLITDIESSPNKVPAIYGEWYHPSDCMWEPDLIDLFDKPKFRKTETPEQKVERERDENGEAM